MRYRLLLLPLLFCSCLSSQVNFYNLSLTDSTKPILYIGHENRVTLKGIKNQPSMSRLAVAGCGSSISKSGNQSYLIRVSTPGICTLTYSEYGKPLYTKKFRAELIPYPIATVSGLRDTLAKVKTLLVNPFISVRYPGCFLKPNYSIISFKATFIKGTDSTETFAFNSSLSTEQIKFIKKLEQGDRIYFDGIRVTEPYGRLRKLSSFWIKIE